MKRHFLLITAMLFSVASAFAQDCDYSGTTGELQWCLKDSTLTISGIGEMPDYSSDFSPWWEYRKDINTGVIETGVTTISGGAFGWCTNLTLIFIPNSVITIGYMAFHLCWNLTSVTIPSSVTTIGNGAFGECSSLTSITIPSSVTTIGNGAFSGCSSLTSINVESENNYYVSEDGVLFNKNKTTIIRYPQGKTGTTYVIPNSVTDIGSGAFSNCNSLIAVTIPNSVTTIGDIAFMGCSSLASIIIPSSVTTIGWNAFSSCSSLTSIDIESGNNNYSSENGVLFDKSKNTLIRCPGGKTGEFVIPSSVTTIEENAFSSCTSLTSITIPNSVTTIKSSAFWGCTSLTLITNLNPVPVEITPSVFYIINLSECTLQVPMGSVSDYQSADVWKEFNIVGINVGIENIKNSIIKIYPNPMAGFLRIESELRIESVVIYDISGKTQKVESRKSENTIDISHLPAGVYFVRLSTEAGEVTKKVLKE